jgi:uncharacterized protein (TIGR03118 family)
MKFSKQCRHTRPRRLPSITRALLAMLALYGASASAQYGPMPPMPMPPPMPPPSSAAGTFVMTSLVSNGAVMGTMTDVNLVNPWGLAEGPDSPVWVANNATQTATAYDSAGVLRASVSLPASSRGPADPTGIVFNSTTDFAVTNGAASAPAQFIMDGAHGTVMAWSQAVDALHAFTVYDDGAGGAVYKGLTLANNGSANLLYATDFHNGKVDVFDAQFHKVPVPGGFADPQLPAGYSPFGIQAMSLGGMPVVVVTYAQHTPQDLDDEVKGPGLGLVNLFDLNGMLLKHLVGSGMQLNAPWAAVLAPASFGSLGNMLLIGNFGDGAINAFDPNTGAFVGSLKNASGQPLAIEGLWGLQFGMDANNNPVPILYFAAGIASQTQGLFGRIDPQP